MKPLIFLTLFISIHFFALSAEISSPVDLKKKNVGVILGDIVNIRKEPNISSQIIDTVKENDYVTIIKWIGTSQKVGKFTDKWVKIKTAKEIEGYLFGAFIFELDALFINWWFYDTSSGVNGYRIFKRNGIVKEVNDYAERHIPGNLDANKKPRFEDNKFIIIGRTLLKNNRPFAYLHRYKEQNMLLDSKLSMDAKQFYDVPFEKRDGVEMFHNLWINTKPLPESYSNTN